jgi:hypothetical protein
LQHRLAFSRLPLQALGLLRQRFLAAPPEPCAAVPQLFCLIPVDQQPPSAMGQGFGSDDPAGSPDRRDPAHDNPHADGAGVEAACAEAAGVDGAADSLPSAKDSYIPAHRDPGYEALVYRCKLELQAERKKADPLFSPSNPELGGNDHC